MSEKPILVKAGDTRVLLNGVSPKVDCRVLSEDYYQSLERQLKEARETEKKAFWSGFEIARMNPDFNDIQAHWGNHLKLKKHNEQLKEQG